jgi:diguanylate cyclase (GGDEF)-like protein
MVDNRKQKNFVLYFILFILFFVLISVIFISIDIDPDALALEKRELISLENQKLDMVNEYLDREFLDYTNDLFFLKEIFIYNSKEETQAIWAAFLDQNPTYLQLRYINKYGDEVIRINQNKDATITIVAPEDLQNKADRYYFQESKIVPDGGLYYSSFDLNVEDGVVEEPRVKTIRIATPIYEKNQFAGIIIINFDLTSLLDVIESEFFFNSCETMLINRNGYYILNSKEPEKEFSFMFLNLINIKFLNDHLDAWKEIYKNQNVEMKTFIGEDGVFNYKYIFNPEQPNIRLHDSNYILITFFNRNSENGKIFYYTQWDLIKNSITEKFHFGVLIFIFSALLAYLLGQREIQKQKITFQARVDSFTKTYNRSYGFFLFEKRNLEYQKQNKNGAICFVDIDSLKFINDTYGHDIGDLLITRTVDRIKKNLSKNDYIIRLGGDEFLIVFEKLSVDEAEIYWKKISTEVNKIQLAENIDFTVWLSHGISEYGQGHDDVMEVISIADKKMYQEKYDRKMKNK